MNDKYKYLDDFNNDKKNNNVKDSKRVKNIKVKDGLVEQINKELILEDGRKLLRD